MGSWSAKVHEGRLADLASSPVNRTALFDGACCRHAIAHHSALESHRVIASAHCYFTLFCASLGCCGPGWLSCPCLPGASTRRRLRLHQNGDMSKTMLVRVSGVQWKCFVWCVCLAAASLCTGVTCSCSQVMASPRGHHQRR